MSLYFSRKTDVKLNITTFSPKFDFLSNWTWEVFEKLIQSGSKSFCDTEDFESMLLLVFTVSLFITVLDEWGEWEMEKCSFRNYSNNVGFCHAHFFCPF